MNPFSLYWKSSWAASSLASPPGNGTRHSKFTVARYGTKNIGWIALCTEETHTPDTPFRQHSQNADSQDVTKTQARVMHTQDLPSSATLALSLKLLQWLRVSMEASSSLKGCTCPCCPPGGKHTSTGNITQSNQVKCISAVPKVSVRSLCNPGSTQVL